MTDELMMLDGEQADLKQTRTRHRSLMNGLAAYHNRYVY